MNKQLNCILIIDDDVPTNFMSTMVIEEAACTKNLQIAESGLKALAYLKKVNNTDLFQQEVIQPDLIFLDINMPCMNGWEFLEEYKNINKSAAQKPVIIMLSTSIHPNDKTRAASIADVAGFECKPLTIEMIEKVFKTFFSGNNKVLVNQEKF